MASASELEAAYARYGPALVRKAKRMLGSESDALDVVQQLFTDFVEKPPRSFDLAYLYAATTRRSLNRIRDGRNRRRLLDDHGEQAFPTLAPSLEGRAVDRQWLHRLVERLDDRDAEVLVLCFVDGLRREEAASALRVSLRTVVNRIGRIRTAAQLLIEEVRDV